MKENGKMVNSQEKALIGMQKEKQLLGNGLTGSAWEQRTQDQKLNKKVQELSQQRI